MHTDKEESVKEFVSRNLGDEVYYRLIDPFCSGVYAGDPSKLSMKAAFGRVGVQCCSVTLVSCCLPDPSKLSMKAASGRVRVQCS